MVVLVLIIFGVVVLMLWFDWRFYFVVLLLVVFIIKREIVYWFYMGNVVSILWKEYKIDFCDDFIGLRLNGDLILVKFRFLKFVVERDLFEIWFFKNWFKFKVDLFIVFKFWDSGVF